MKGGNKFQSELNKLEGLLNRLNPTKPPTHKSGGKPKTSAKKASPPVKKSSKKSEKKSVKKSSKKSEKMAGGTKPDVDVRHFKLVKVDGKEITDGGRYDLPSKTRSGKVNRRGPKDVASKVFSELCRKRKRGDECKYKISISETTQGSSHKIYHYEAIRVKLSKAEREASQRTVVENGKKRVIENKYKNVLKSLGSEKKQNHKGGYF